MRCFADRLALSGRKEDTARLAVYFSTFHAVRLRHASSLAAAREDRQFGTVARILQQTAQTFMQKYRDSFGIARFAPAAARLPLVAARARGPPGAG